MRSRRLLIEWNVTEMESASESVGEELCCACGPMSFWVRPDFDRTVRAGGDHFSGFDGVVLGPGYHFVVDPRGRVRLQGGRLIPSSKSTKNASIRGQSGRVKPARFKRNLKALTSSRSQAQTAPFSSPQTTLASLKPKHARHR